MKIKSKEPTIGEETKAQHAGGEGSWRQGWAMAPQAFANFLTLMDDYYYTSGIINLYVWPPNSVVKNC